MRKTSYICIALAVLLTFGALSQMANALYPTTNPWLMYRHDISRSGTGSSTAPNNNATVWTSTNYAGSIEPLVAEGKVIYCYSYDAYALDEATGIQLWKSFDMDGSVATAGAISGGVMYVGSSAGTLYAINITDGSKIWSYASAPGQIQSSPVVSGQKLFFTTTGNYTYALDINGTNLWRYGGINLGPIYSSPAIQGNLLYFGCDNGQIYALNVSGSLPILKWHYNTNNINNHIRTTPCLANGKVYVTGSSVSQLYVFNATTGQVLWSWRTSVTGNYGLSSPTYYATSPHPLIFVTGGYSRVYALYADAQAGGNYTENDPSAKYWSTDLGVYTLYYSPVVADGKVFVSASYYLYALTVAGTGTVAWFYHFANSPAEPAIADGRVFCSAYYSIVCIGNYFPPITYFYTVNIQGNIFNMKLVIANATPSREIGTQLYLLQGQLNYTLQGISGTNGWSNITIPDNVLNGPYTILLDGGGVNQSVVDNLNGTHSIYFAYQHSTHSVVIQGTPVIPEFPTYAILSLLAALSLAAVVLAKKKQFKK
jgi:outer membrane protein assembly factor BamB